MSADNSTRIHFTRSYRWVCDLAILNRDVEVDTDEDALALERAEISDREFV